MSLLLRILVFWFNQKQIKGRNIWVWRANTIWSLRWGFPNHPDGLSAIYIWCKTSWKNRMFTSNVFKPIFYFQKSSTGKKPTCQGHFFFVLFFSRAPTSNQGRRRVDKQLEWGYRMVLDVAEINYSLPSLTPKSRLPLALYTHASTLAAQSISLRNEPEFIPVDQFKNSN